MKKAKYWFTSKEGSLSYDFRDHKETAYIVDAANYGGLSIEPSRACANRN